LRTAKYILVHTIEKFSQTKLIEIKITAKILEKKRKKAKIQVVLEKRTS